MPRIDSFYQYIVPLIFIAIWAVTSLFNREAQPLPPRSGRPQGPNGPRPAATTSRSSEWRPETTPRESLLTRPGSQNLPSRPGGRKEDDILIIEAEPRRTSAPSTPRVGASLPRRASKTRSTGQASPRGADPVTPRNLSLSMTRPENPPTIQSQSLKPLVLPPSPLLTTPNDEAAKTQAGRALVSQLDSFSSEEIRQLVHIPGRLREGFISAELLKPPLALRGRPLGPRRRPGGS